MVMGALASPFEGPSAATSTLGSSTGGSRISTLASARSLSTKALRAWSGAALLEELHDLGLDLLEGRQFAAAGLGLIVDRLHLGSPGLGRSWP